MVCKKCGNEISENINFCPICGAKADRSCVLPEPSHPDVIPEVNSKNGEKASQFKSQKKRSGIFMFILSFSLFLGILTGMLGAFYTAKNGWESIPFADKLAFLPFVKLDKEKTETYSDPIYEDTDMEEDYKEKDIIDD